MSFILVVLGACATIVVVVSLGFAERMTLRVEESERCVATIKWKNGGVDRCRLVSDHGGPHVVKQMLKSGRYAKNDYWWHNKEVPS